MAWTLFPKDKTPPSETAEYSITYAPFHPCVRAPWTRSTTVRVRGYRNRQTTVQAIKASGGQVVKVTQRGR